jgi:hypothetical protein
MFQLHVSAIVELAIVRLKINYRRKQYNTTGTMPPKMLYNITPTEMFGFRNTRHRQTRQHTSHNCYMTRQYNMWLCSPQTQCAARLSCDQTMLRHASDIPAGEYALPYHDRPQARQSAPKIAAVCARQE